MQYNDDTFNSRNEFNNDLTHITNDKDLDIMKVQRYINEVGFDTYRLKTLYYRKEILNKKEKDYLSAVIKPFRDDIEYISKTKKGNKMFIYIRFKSDGDMDFPNLKSDILYKGMELRKYYTIKELGL